MGRFLWLLSDACLALAMGGRHRPSWLRSRLERYGDALAGAALDWEHRQESSQR